MRRLALAGVALALACSGCATGLTGEPSTVGADDAFVSGDVVANAAGQVEYWFEYGPTTAYGSQTAHQSVAVEQNQPAGVFAELSGLTRSTTYHYRLCAQDGSQTGGPGCGEDRTVKTQSFACGETVTTDVRLTGDVSCATSPIDQSGIVVGAPGIVIDLNGHQMLGPAFVGGGAGAAGVANDGGFDDVTVRDGLVGNFGDGVRLDGASRNRIIGMDAVGPGDGIRIEGGADNEVRHSDAGGRESGLVARDTTGLVVADGTASGSFGNALVFVRVSDGRIVRNEVSGGGNACCSNLGISVSGNRNVIKANRASGWTGGNIVLTSGGDNKLLDNEAFDAELPEVEPEERTANGDGIFVGPFTAGTVLRRNYAHGNAGDGIEVQGSASRLGENRADDNGDFGIDAAAGIIDLGGNTASGNGNPLQCRNVFCAPSP